MDYAAIGSRRGIMDMGTSDRAGEIFDDDLIGQPILIRIGEVADTGTGLGEGSAFLSRIELGGEDDLRRRGRRFIGAGFAEVVGEGEEVVEVDRLVAIQIESRIPNGRSRGQAKVVGELEEVVEGDSSIRK